MNRQARKSQTIWRNLRSRRGTRATIATHLNLRWQTLDNWTRVPLEHVFAVSKVVRMPPEDLRPDFFCNDPLRKSAFTVSLPESDKVRIPQRSAPVCVPTSPAAVPETDRDFARTISENHRQTDKLAMALRSSP